uniref:Kinesin motor domain-containing protein n=1 Tax=Anabas testudineus TaxID=64144 RepID=A0AAQ6IHG5_ANATE
MTQSLFTVYHSLTCSIVGKALDRAITLCLYECLRAAGHRNSHLFTSMGVCRAAHLSALTMEDYPILGINTMEDRTRLFHLVQIIKTDLEHDDDYDDKGYTVVDSNLRSHLSDHRTRENTEPDNTGSISLYNSHTRLSSTCVSFHEPKPRPATVTSKRLNNKPRKGISRKEKLWTDRDSYGTSRHTSKRAGDQRISVCVRKRPLTHAESRKGEADVVTTPGGECVIVHEGKEAVDLTQYILQHRFYFDQVFGEDSSNEEVYHRTAYPLVQHIGKATCFAYGQTGAGKTHTMLGSSPRRPGLYALAVRDIFAHLSDTHTYSRLLVYVSFFEIYRGQLYDLLDHRKRLFAREDGQKVVHIAGLRDVRVDSVSSLLEVCELLLYNVNELTVKWCKITKLIKMCMIHVCTRRMWFVDLAGSERASDTKEPDRQSRMEGAEINQSLLALKECIRSLDQEQSHTPFRQSKLTQVLKDSFVGDSMTCMIANISPGHLATEHTLNTLRYADRVKELRRQGAVRGGRRGKTLPSPKHNLSYSNSSGGTRGKSPPKKAKLGRQREEFGPTSPTTMMPTGEAILCSTPKNSTWGEETSPRGIKSIGLEHITPVRGWLGTVDKREMMERRGEQKDRGRENKRTDSHSVTRAGLVLGQTTSEGVVPKGNLSFTRRKSVFSHREKEQNQQSTMKVEKEGGRKWIERQRQVKSSRATCREVEMQNDRHVKKADEKDKEKERHLRWYHEQLQQFMPSSGHLLSPSSSNQASLCSPVSPSSCSSLQQSPPLSLSALMY